MTGYLLLQNNRTALVQPNQMERILADVDSDRVDGFRCILRCAHRMLLELCAASASRVCAMLLPSGAANTRCSVCRFDPGGLHVPLSPAPGTGFVNMLLDCPCRPRSSSPAHPAESARRWRCA